MRPPLVRARRSVLGGVCAGLAVHLGWSVRRIRLVTVLLTLCGGSGALFYLWLWALVPLEAGDKDEHLVIYRKLPVAALLVMVGAVAAMVSFGALVEGDESLTTRALVVVILASGGAVAWSLGFDGPDPHRTPRYATTVRIGSVALLLLAGSVTLSARPNAMNAVLGVVMVVFGVGVFAAPRVVALWSDLMAERAARVRQQQRAEIAAHLHDSVLQTLALIQNRAGASSEVARIARAQERELRNWLFAGDEPAGQDLAAELRSVAAAIELDYAVRIDVVAAGESVVRSSAALLAAAREAMLNAARHAGGDVSVYLESGPDSIDVFIRDRGPGVNLDDLPGDRLGIRESIIGRMMRAGGTATVRPVRRPSGASSDQGSGSGSGSAKIDTEPVPVGTEVHLHLEVSA
ncbi:phage shock protein C (PspC) family protein [Glaciihabitans tibetensis]|uniref:Phage shock protein C (PspC) family protein n=1 Tax=Glaciihabitans tibetensis TaxID=1266600 RepID=A0A2T0V736_9MICO|nr:phage shock protein C (PspC) family protein [Glaciihabitans tibetensis]